MKSRVVPYERELAGKSPDPRAKPHSLRNKQENSTSNDETVDIENIS